MAKGLILENNEKIEQNQFSYKKFNLLNLKEIKSVFIGGFKNCTIKKLVIENVENLFYSSFQDNKIDELVITQKLQKIPDACFSNNHIKSLTLPNTMEEISDFAFYNNQISKLILPEGLRVIGFSAFENNKLSSVKIPDSVEEIGVNAFDNIEIEYRGIKFDKVLVSKIGVENIITYYNICKNKLIDADKIPTLTKEALYNLPLNKESLKGYCANYRKYEMLKNSVSYEFKSNLSNKRFNNSLFKACGVLGVFSNPDSEVIDIIKEMLNTYTLEEFSDFWDIYRPGNRVVFKPGYKKLFVNMYKNGNISPDDERLNRFIYGSFEELKKYSFRRHEAELKYIKDKILKNPEDIEVVKSLQAEYDLKKTKLKDVTEEDVNYFLSSVKYNIRPGNESIKEILNYVANYSIDMVDELQDIYEQGKESKKNIPYIKDKNMDENSFKYKWIKEDDPLNLVLGIICDCCACLENGGKDIMKQSAINPNIVNLALCDENDKIVGKSTAYINKEKKYVLFNNIETKEFGTKGLKSKEQRQKECLQALLRAVDDLVEVLKKENIDISKVAVGMHCNDLREAIINYNLEIEYVDMLKNFPYEGYRGDANDPDYGQAILYKDDEINKEKNI